jgi:glycosyltransferase involved in cell wall biosynthesis
MTMPENPRRARPSRVLYYFASHHIDTGSPKALLGLIQILDRHRVTPLFLASAAGPLIAELERRHVHVVLGPKPATASPRHPIRSLSAIARFARFLSANSVDLVHINELGWNLDLVFAAVLKRIPVVLHVHLPEAIAWQNLHRFAASRILLVSEAHKQAIRHFERISGKTDVMYNSVDLDLFAKGQDIRAQFGLTSDDIIVGTLAQLRRGKAIDVLLGAARALLPRYPRLVFLVAGRIGHGEEDYGKALMAEAESPEFRGRFRFLGSRQDVPDLLATYDLFVLPTRAETFGIAVVEAMAAGVPVVSSRIGAITEIVSSQEIGRVVDTIDAPSFAAAIEELIAMPDRGRSVGARGRESLIGRFDAASLSRRIHGIYDRLLAR